jgi:hypothetical protein
MLKEGYYGGVGTGKDRYGVKRYQEVVGLYCGCIIIIAAAANVLNVINMKIIQYLGNTATHTLSSMRILHYPLQFQRQWSWRE